MRGWYIDLMARRLSYTGLRQVLPAGMLMGTGRTWTGMRSFLASQIYVPSICQPAVKDHLDAFAEPGGADPDTAFKPCELPRPIVL